MLAPARLMALTDRGDKGDVAVHQINFALQYQPGLRPEMADKASKEILERLIDQALAVPSGMSPGWFGMVV